MEISGIPPIGDAAHAQSNTAQATGHNFSLRVQGAIGPKSLSGYGIEGRVLVAFSIGNDGSLTALRIARSSGYDQLDQAAIQIVSKTAFPVPPSGLSAVRRNFVSAFSFA
jgi:TonB family protein